MVNEKDKQAKIEDDKKLKIIKDVEDSADKKPDEEPSVETAKNFNELYDVLKKTGEIIGSDGIRYKADNLIGKIDKLREGLKKIREKDEIKKLKVPTQEAVKKLIESGSLKVLMCQITRTDGLRIRVVKLLIDEVITREVSRGIVE